MDIDYSLFKDSTETKTEKIEKKESKKEIIAIPLIILIAFILLYSNSSKTQPLEKKELIHFLSNVNKTKTTEINNKNNWNSIFKYFDAIFKLYKFYEIYEKYIDEPFNVTGRVSEFFNYNLTRDIFDLNNYIKIKDYLGLNGDVRRIVENGVLVLSLVLDTDIINIRFEKQYFFNLLKGNKKFPLNIRRFIILSFVFYFADEINVNSIIEYANNLYYYGIDKMKEYIFGN